MGWNHQLVDHHKSMVLEFHPVTWSLQHSMTWRCGFYMVFWADRNHQHSVWFKSDQPWSFKPTTTQHVAYVAVRASWKLTVPQHTLYVESSWAHGPLVGMCHGKRRRYSLCTPESARQTQYSRQLSLRVSTCGRERITCNEIQWSKPLNHSGTAVWRRVHSRFLFGCQGRPIMDQKKWHTSSMLVNSRQCFGLVYLGGGDRRPPTIRAQLCCFRWAPKTAKLSSDGTVTIDSTTRDCQQIRIARGYHFDKKTGGLQTRSVIIIKRDWSALAAIPMSHCRRQRVWFRCAIWLVNTEQLSSILAKINHFATHLSAMSSKVVGFSLF